MIDVERLRDLKLMSRGMSVPELHTLLRWVRHEKQRWTEVEEYIKKELQTENWRIINR